MSPVDSRSSIRSVAKRPNQYNPLYGYSIESIRAVKPKTMVYRIKASVFERFLKPPIYKEWAEHKLLPVFPP